MSSIAHSFASIVPLLRSGLVALLLTGALGIGGACELEVIPPDVGLGRDAFSVDSAVDSSIVDAALPDAALPDGALPDGALPDGALPDGALPDGALPDAVGPQPLPAPDGLTAVAARASVGLDWDPVAGADSYNLYWSTSPGTGSSSGARLGDVLPGYVHRDLTPGTTYYYVVTAQDAAGEGPPSAEAEATPGGELTLVGFSSGEIEDLASGATVQLPVADRVHLLLLPEGYLRSDLEAGTFDDDVDDWHQELFAIEPYASYREAFVIWQLERASHERVTATAPQQADTAFQVPLTADGDGVDGDIPLTGPTAQRVWDALADFPYPPTSFFPAGGRWTYLARNLVVHVLVLDPDLGRSGLSGRARRLENPNDGGQRLSVAIAHNRPHELSHAFARLVDEYLDDAIPGLGVDNDLAVTSAWVSNVVATPTCATLPWAHLLHGAAHNHDVDQLVGAFGVGTIGFHSELKCLMNGTHDNALYYGGDGRLRVYDRFCNFCAELVAFRLFERVGLLPDPATSWHDWTERYRAPHYTRVGLLVPAAVPQENSAGEAWFEPCVP